MSAHAALLASLRDLALRAAAAGAAVHRAHRGKRLEITAKATPTDVVTVVDHEAERAIVETIMAARPDDAVLAEEQARHEGTSGVRWVVDPLDGTTNYVYAWPAYGVSIGVEVDGRRAVGVVHDSALGRVYAAVAGGTATCDGAPIRVRDAVPLATALVATGFQPFPAQRTRQGLVLARLLAHVRDVRRGGSAAIDLCAVAAGHLDAYYELGLGAWDMAGGLVVAEAAGARVHELPVANARGPLVVVGPPAVADALLRALEAAGALEPLPPLA
jgi:myo-inositol-1(or 4)-monophosphatase